jgi:hypothetical protein
MLLATGVEREPDADECGEEVRCDRPCAVAGHDGEVGAGPQLLDPDHALRCLDLRPTRREPGMLEQGVGYRKTHRRIGHGSDVKVSRASHLLGPDRLDEERVGCADVAQRLEPRPRLRLLGREVGVLGIETSQRDPSLDGDDLPRPG